MLAHRPIMGNLRLSTDAVSELILNPVNDGKIELLR